MHFQKRGNDVLGLSDSLGSDNLPYSTLSYSNGRGLSNTYDKTGARLDLTKTNFSDPYLNYMSMIGRDGETHGGDDVGVYASGPYSHLFTGIYEQNIIPVAMAYAPRIGLYASDQQTCSGVPNWRVCVTIFGLTALLCILQMIGF